MAQGAQGEHWGRRGAYDSATSYLSYETLQSREEKWRERQTYPFGMLRAGRFFFRELSFPIVVWLSSATFSLCCDLVV